MMEQQVLASLLPLALAIELERLAARGGPVQADWDRARACARTLGERGDILLYRGARPGETARIFAAFAQAMAIMSYIPGGWTAFGLHVCAGVPDLDGQVCHTDGGIRPAARAMEGTHEHA